MALQAAVQATCALRAHPFGMLRTLLLFGITGDLAGRYLLPALGALHVAGRLPGDLRLLGATSGRWDDAALRQHAEARLARFAPDLPRASRDAVLRALTPVRLDLREPGAFSRALAGLSQDAALAAYLALPTQLLPQALDLLQHAPLAGGSRVAIEKPFGLDLASAGELSLRTSRFLSEHGPGSVYLVDFLLGMAPVQNLLTLRRANPLLESAWRRERIERVDLHWEETLGLEGRAGSFDHTGILRDVVQSHVLQLLAHVAMELPLDLADHRALQRARLAAVRAIRPLSARDVATDTRRARYGRGVLHGAVPGAPDRPTPAYVDEDGVDPTRDTETFTRLQLWLDTPRWKGVPFVIRAGKALPRMRKELVLHLRPAQGFAGHATHLRIGIDGPKDLDLTLLGSAASPRAGPAALTLFAPPPPSSLPAYARVLEDLLGGHSALAVLPEEALAAWEVLDPVLQGWGRGDVPMETYPAGSTGPQGGLGSNGSRAEHPSPRSG